jgi:hypothetical protein
MTDKIAEEYQNKGFVIIKNLIDKNEVQKFGEIAKRHNHKGTNNNVVDYFYDYIRIFDFRIYPKYLKFIDLRYLIDSLYLISKSKNADWKLNMSSIYKNEAKSVSKIDSYISKRSDEDILEWHTDQAFGGATHPPEFFNNSIGKVSTKNINKLFLHITDVKYKNGAFSYIPYSHKINLAIRELINKQAIKYKPFLLLQDAINLVANEHREKFLKILNEHEIENFIKNAQTALDNEEEFSIECNAGDAVLFNDFGYHKGTAPKISDRIIFRYFY